MRPYHTPKSERDEAVGKLLDLEARRPFYRFNAIFTDKAGKTVEWDFRDHTCGEAYIAVNAEAKLQNEKAAKCGPFPEIGNVVKIELYDFAATEWFNWYL